MSAMAKGSRGKVNRKKIFSYVVVFLLVGGLLLGAMGGFFDFLWGGKNLAFPAGEDEFVLNLKKQADYLEKDCRRNPGDGEKQTTLGSIYFELAMYYQGLGREKEGKDYAGKSLKLLLPAAEEGLLEPFTVLKIALLAAFVEKDESSAEKYFLETLKLQDDYPEAHFYYGLFLASQERVPEAKNHWENVLQQVEEDSFWGREAQHYLQIYTEEDEEQETGFNE